jgi:hypothetical protein
MSDDPATAARVEQHQDRARAGVDIPPGGFDPRRVAAMKAILDREAQRLLAEEIDTDARVAPTTRRAPRRVDHRPDERIRLPPEIES